MYRLFFFCLVFLLVFRAQGQEAQPQPSPINSFLLQNSVNGMGKDGLGFLWVSTQFGLLRYDGFKSKTYTTNTESELLSNRFGYLHPVPGSKDLVTYNESQGFLISNGQIKPYPIQRGEVMVANQNTWICIQKTRLPKSLRSNEQRIVGAEAILFFPNDTLLLEENVGLFSLSKQKTVILQSELTHIGNYFFSIAGKSYAFGMNGIYSLSLEGNQLRSTLRYRLEGEKKIISNSQGGCWFISKEKLYQWDPKTNLATQTPKEDVFGPHPPSSIFEENNNIYAGTGTAGILEKKVFKGKILKQYQNGEVTDNYIYSYCWSSKLNSFVSVSPQGLSTFTSPQRSNMLFAGKANPSFVYNDQEDRLWFDNGTGEIQIVDPTNNKIVQKIPWGEGIRQIVQTNSTEYVITGIQHVIKWNKQNGKLDTLFKSQAGTQILTTSYYNKQLVIGTTQGLFSSSSSGFKRHLPQQTIRTLISLNDSTLVIGSYSHGVFKKVGEKITPLPIDDRSFLLATVALSLDADGDLWVITNKGAFLWNKESFLRNLPPDYLLETNQELPVNELNGGQIPGMYFQNELVFPSSSGLVVVKKEDLFSNQPITHLAISAFQVDGKRKDFAKEVSLTPSHQSLEIDFDIAFSDNPNQFQAEYRIQELSSNWIKIPFSRKLSFNRLSAGKYALEVRKAPNQPAETLVHFTISQFWYLKPWLWFLAFILGLLIVSLLYYGRILWYQKRQSTLNGLIRERTHDLQNSLSKLAESKKSLRQEYRQKNKLYGILMHDLTSPLQFLSSFAIAQYSKAKPEKEALRIIASTSNELAGFIQEFLFWLKRQNNRYSLQFKLLDINELLHESVQFYQPIAQLNGNKILFFSNQPSVYWNTDAEIIKVVFRNLLDNANKFTQQGVIKVSAEKQGDQLSIYVEDSGEGLPKHLLKIINSPHQTSTYDPSINANHKMGLKISKEFVNLLGGTIHAEAVLGQGTRFTLQFNPLK